MPRCTVLAGTVALLTLALVFPTGGRLRPRLYAGPSLALELGCGWSLDERSDLSGGVRSSGARRASPQGGGLDIRIGGGALTADVRYNLGLIDIDESDATSRNRAFQVLPGYSYVVR
jgi:hypothetical protein